MGWLVTGTGDSCHDQVTTRENMGDGTAILAIPSRVPHDTAMSLIPLLGLCWDGSASRGPGAALGPAQIRAALHDPAGNGWSRHGVDAVSLLTDLGDITVAPGLSTAGAMDAITDALDARLPDPATPLLLGGDHSVTLPVLRVLARRGLRPAILHLDAHPDLYPDFEGDRYSHACPFARILEEDLASALVQVGIRTMNDVQRDTARRFGVRSFLPEEWEEGLASLPAGPLYLSLDLDVLDPSFAPGVAHPEPGGLSVREVLALLDRLPPTLVGADIVEYTPPCDVSGATARVAARLVKELVPLMVRS